MIFAGVTLCFYNWGWWCLDEHRNVLLTLCRRFIKLFF